MDYKKFTTLNEDIISIRKAVFIEEQGFQNEFDKFDKNCTHIVLYDKGKAVAVCRYFKENGMYHLGRVAIVKEYRGKHLGNYILQTAENEIKKEGGKSIVVSAQVRAKGFYNKNGYIESGEIFFDEYCEHINMIKKV